MYEDCSDLSRHEAKQQIIKKIMNTPKGLLHKVIRSQLFSDAVPRFSDDVTRAMLGQPKRLSCNYLRRIGGKCGEKSL